ncbi:MAG TPA: YraN family protein, partial [Phycisphaerales bacterium]|nr:YraN family protein [Phycisphaerales bacterium]
MSIWNFFRAAGNQRSRLGRRGERYAARWLRRRGFRILRRNLSVGKDEADLLARDPDGVTLVIVEVKTRRSSNPPPELAITRHKQQHLTQLAARVLKQKRFQDCAIRFDV